MLFLTYTTYYILAENGIHWASLNFRCCSLSAFYSKLLTNLPAQMHYVWKQSVIILIIILFWGLHNFKAKRTINVFWISLPRAFISACLHYIVHMYASMYILSIYLWLLPCLATTPSLSLWPTSTGRQTPLLALSYSGKDKYSADTSNFES